VTQIKFYKSAPEIWDPSPKEFGGPKTSQFGAYFAKLRNLIGTKQGIVERKTALIVTSHASHLGQLSIRSLEYQIFWLG